MDFKLIAIILTLLALYAAVAGSNTVKKARFVQWWASPAALLVALVSYYYFLAGGMNSLINTTNDLLSWINSTILGNKLIPEISNRFTIELVYVIAAVSIHSSVKTFLQAATMLWYKVARKFSTNYKPNLPEKYEPKFAYEVDAKEFIVLKNEWVFPAIFTEYAYWGFLGYVILGLLEYFLGDIPFASPLAIIPFMVVLEVYWYLEGERPVHKKEDRITAEEPDVKALVSYYNLWEEYQVIWPDKLLLAWQLSDSGDRDQNLIDNDAIKYDDLQYLHRRGYAISDREYQIYKDLIEERKNTSARQVSTHADVVIQSPFYDRIAPVLITALLRKILEGKHILVVTPIVNFDTSSYHDSLKAWLEEWFELVSGNRLFWSVRSYDRMDNAAFDASVVVSSAEELLSKQLLTSPWFDKLSAVVFFDTSKLFAESPTTNFILLNILRENNPAIQSILLSDYRMFLQQSAKRNLDIQRDLNETEISYPDAKRSFLLFWKLEGQDQFYHQLSYGVHEAHIGPEVALALPAWREQVSPIIMTDQHEVPWNEYREEIDNMRDMLKQGLFKDHQLSGSSREVIHNIYNDFEYKQKDHYFLTVRDKNYNLVAALRKWNSIADVAFLLHVVSPPYLLRDYFIDNLEYFKRSPIEPLSTSLMNCKFTVGLDLLERMVSDSLPESRVNIALNKLSGQQQNTTFALRELFIEAFGIDIIAFGYLSHKEEYVYDEKRNEFVKKNFYSLNPEIKKTKELSFLNTIKVTDEFENNVLKTISYDLLYQKYLPGQSHAFDGRTYSIKSLDLDNHILRTNNTNPEKNLFYREDKTITLKEVHRAGDAYVVNPQAGVNLELCEGSFDIVSNGYFDFKTNLSFEKVNQEFTYSKMTTRQCPIREYRLGRVLKITFSSTVLGAKQAVVANTLVVLLNELFVTLFPDSHHYIMAASESTDLKYDNFVKLYPELINRLTDDGQVSSGDDQGFSLYFFEDAHQDLGLVNTIFEQWNFIFRILDDYLSWLLSDVVPSKDEESTEVTSLIAAEFRKSVIDRSAFLSYGTNGIPGHLDITETYAFLQGLLGDNNMTKQRNQFYTGAELDMLSQAGDHNCDFCGRLMPTTQLEVLEDNRERCNKCKQTAVDAEEDLRVVYEEAKQYFVQRSLDIMDGIEVKFVSASKIQKQHGKTFNPSGGFDERVSGLAVQQNGNHAIWIENGQPRMRLMATLIHELTHIWQYEHLNLDKMKQELGLLLIEGHANWASIDGLNEKYSGDVYIQYLKEQDNDPGHGYQLLDQRLKADKQQDAFSYLLAKYGL